MTPHVLSRRRAGFSLVEVMAALIIFGVAVVAYLQSMGTAVSVQGELAARQRAQMLAQNVMEEIRYTNSLEPEDQDGKFEKGDAGFAWASRVATSPTDGLMEVTVTITWSDGGREKDYTLSTLMMETADPGEAGL